MEVLVMAAIAGAGALGAWVADRRRARRRNRAGRCGACNTAWTASNSTEPYLVHGQLVCEECAMKARKRMPWQLGAIGVFTLVALGSAAAVQGAAGVILFSAFGTAGMLVGAVRAMKRANWRAQLRIALGDDPAMASLHPGE